jgi:UDP-GlcNAc:undecaprenyl-phosphate GlcNAc-1-phosphate transferase
MNLTLGMAVFAALLISLSGTFVARGAARRLDWLDQPSRRKMHTDPIPLLGGIAMYLAFVIAIPIADSRTVIEEGIVVLAGATILLVVGVIDDRRGINPRPKLMAQVAAALLLVIGGVGVNFLPFDWLNAAATIVWVVGICNAMNLLDNMDGLSAGVAAIACAFFTALAIIHGQIWVSIVAAVLLGAVLGFLRYNWNPATIFMGDAGSLLLGFMLAVLAIKLRFPGVDPQRSWMIPILVLAVPIFDTTLVTISRLRRGVSISSGGRDHVSHRLVRLGLSVRQSVTIIYLAALLCGGAAIRIAVQHSLPYVYALAILLVIAAVAALILLEQVDLSDTGQAVRAPEQRRLARLRRLSSELVQRPG